MIRNYIKVAFRNLLRHKGYALINIFGLTLSIASATLLYLYVQHETSYDTQHEKSERTYRLVEPIETDGLVRQFATTAPPVGQALVDEFPEVIASTRLFSSGHLDFVIDGERFMERSFYMADSTFFDVFDFELLRGDHLSALSQPSSAVITRSLAIKFFGKVDAIGEALISPNGRELIVTGVLEDIPENSHLQFNLLLYLSYDDDRTNAYLQMWDVGRAQTYITLNDAANMLSLNEQLPAFFDKNFSDPDRSFFLQPLEDVYLHSGDIVNLTFQPRGNPFYIQLFVAIAVFILLISCINYMNLATAKSMERAKEIGLRKVSGAIRPQLIMQILSESLVTAFVGFALAIGLVDIMLPFFNEITGKEFDLTISNVVEILPVMAGFAFFVGLMAGSYPAIILSNMVPSAVLRGQVRASKQGIRLRQGLVITQFALSIFMIIATMIVLSQMDYVRSKSLGFNKENLIVVDINNGSVRSQWETIRHEFSNLPGVTTVSAVSRVPGEWKALNRTEVVTPYNTADTLETYFMSFDENTLEVFSMSLVSGENFQNGAVDTTKLLVNKAMIKFMGWEEAVGQELRLGGVAYPFTVIGVVDDFHFQSLYDEIQPMVIGAGNNAVMALDYFVLKTQGGDMQEVLDGIAKVHNIFDDRTSVEIHFLDQELERFYKNDVQAGALWGIGATITLLISCLGLFGLISFFAEMKTKEVSVRKVLGASPFQLIVLLSKSFIAQVGFGFVIAAPVAWYMMNGWLNTYSYRIPMPVYVYIVAALIAVLVTLATISYRAIKTSRINPARTLKQE